jgi:glutathione S-transferase
MTDALILHHYPLSPYSEKIRRIFAWKRCPWTSVRAPAVMPKPDLIPLTGGYRKIPVLQVGNHVYCDTALIARVIEQRCPEPSLYPSPIVQSLAEWADERVFNAALPWILRPTRFDDMIQTFTPDELTKFADDRKAMRDGPAPAPSGKSLRAQFAIYVTRLERTFEQQPYLLGKSPCIADFSAYHPLWLISRTGPEALAPFPRVLDFVQRMAAMPEAPVTELTSEQALALCKASDPAWQEPGPFVDGTGLQPEQAVVVRASDYGRDPVHGKLRWASLDELVIVREDERAGTVYVHFPRIGYDIAAA